MHRKHIREIGDIHTHYLFVSVLFICLLVRCLCVIYFIYFVHLSVEIAEILLCHVELAAVENVGCHNHMRRTCIHLLT